MGTGKSTVGELIAETLGWRFIDSDQLIVVLENMPIKDIFAHKGEAYFRQIERRVATELAEMRRIVVATGGGMMVDADNRTVMGVRGLLVCLNATPDVIEQRIGGATNRPLLKDDWRALLESRREAYAALPYQVDTTGKTPEQVAEEVVALWHRVST
jgi:shikimate kinase